MIWSEGNYLKDIYNTTKFQFKKDDVLKVTMDYPNNKVKLQIKGKEICSIPIFQNNSKCFKFAVTVNGGGVVSLEKNLNSFSYFSNVYAPKNEPTSPKKIDSKCILN